MVFLLGHILDLPRSRDLGRALRGTNKMRQWACHSHTESLRYPGRKHPGLVDGQGIPLAVEVTPANPPEIKALLPLVDSAGPLDEATAEPAHRPAAVYGDRGYDAEPHREQLRARGIDPQLAKRR